MQAIAFDYDRTETARDGDSAHVPSLLSCDCTLHWNLMTTPLPIQQDFLFAARFRPRILSYPDAWVGHIPFGAWLIRNVRPSVFVELGTHSGNSYFAFCQAVSEAQLTTRCFAVDTWKGDEHAGFYGERIFSDVCQHNDAHYSGFSSLLRITFDEACPHFASNSIDLLHIDGMHSYEAVRHDFETWLPKLAPGAVVMFHDTNVREQGFGVWRFWDEICQLHSSCLEFTHSHGLGVAQIGPRNDEQLLDWLLPDSDRTDFLDFFARLGEFAHLDYSARGIHYPGWRDPRDIENERLNKGIERLNKVIERLNEESATREGELRASRSELQTVWKQLAISTEHIKRLSEQVQRLNKLSLWQFIVRGKDRFEDSESLDSDAATILLSPFFDAGWYVAQYPDVAGMEPARHYADFGRKEGRQPGPLFDGPWYLEQNPDVADFGLNPLVHYMKYGWAEGRAIRVSASGGILKTPVLTSKLTPLSKPKTTDRSKASRSVPLAVDLQFPIDKLSPDRDSVVVIVHEASRTGAPILAWNIAGELQKRYNVVVLLRRGGPLEHALCDVGAAAVRLPDHFPTHGDAVEAVVDRLVTIYAPIFVIANSVETRYFVPDFEKLGVPVVALVHEFSSHSRPVGVLSSLFETASQIVFPAQIVAEAAAKDYRSLEARDFKILPQGPTKMPVCANPSTPNVQAKTDVKGLWPTDSENSLLVIGIGTVNIRKGVDFFISAAAAVHRAMPNHEVRFAWVGKCYSFDQPYREYLNEQIERSGLTDAFVFIDEVADVKPIYDQADIFFLSSRLDPLPNVAIDSAFNGIPVVCFDHASGMAEILAETADTRELVVPYLDAGAAGQVICGLAGDPARLARLSQAVRTVAVARFSMARYIEAIDELGRNAKTVLDQLKRDHALISKNDAFNADLYLGIGANTSSADEGLSRYLNASRLVAPRGRPHTGLLIRRPMEGFHPLIYASDNPQFDEESGEDPLAHYVRTGRPDGRWSHQVLRPDNRPAPNGTSLSIAIHGHFHYPQLLPDFIKRLKRNAAAVDLYLTTTTAAKAEELSKLIAASYFARANITVVPNRGRDIGPMLSLGESVLSGYDIVGHFHSKRSAHVDEQIGELWRNFLLEHLIGGEFAMLDVVLGAFAADPGLGLVFAEEPHLNDWDNNRACADELARHMGLALALPTHFDFPIGTMFWARSAALKPLFDLKLTWGDYPEEPLPIDGTVLHALERLLPFSAGRAGYRYATTYVKSWTR